jgi:hypothetical protein
MMFAPNAQLDAKARQDNQQNHSMAQTFLEGNREIAARHWPALDRSGSLAGS